MQSQNTDGKLVLMLHLWRNPRDGVYYRKDGQRKKSLKTKDYLEARRLFNAYKRNRLNDQIAELDGIGKKTLADFRDDYADSRKGYAPDTLRADKLAFDKATAFFGEKRAIATIKPEDIHALRVDLLKVIPKSVKTHFRHLAAAFAVATELGHVRRNPFVGRKRRPYGTMNKESEERKAPAYIGVPELSAIVLNVPPRFGEMLWLYWLTGMRRRELVRMKWEQVGDAHLTIIGKGGKRRTFPLTDDIRALLGPQGKPDARIFPQWKADTVTRMFRKAANEAGLKDADLHHLRHAFSSRMAMAGVDADTRMRLMGHASLQMCDRYSHVTDEHIKTMLEKAEGA